MKDAVASGPQLNARFEKLYRGAVAIECNMTVPIDRTHVTVLLGPSGCGKTTVLRCIAGLVRPSSGVITLGDQTCFDQSRRINLSPLRRRIGFCFQTPALLPHLNVRQNVAFGLPRAERSSILVDEHLDALEIGDLTRRRIQEISAGQAQRVSLARSLILKPRFMLLDEPFAALDAGLRVRMRRWLLTTLRRSNIAAIVVSHDREEAVSMADHLIVMDRGQMLQSGPPAEIFAHPINEAVAELIGIETLLRGTVIDWIDGIATTDIDGTPIRVHSKHVISGPVTLCIHGDSITISPRSNHPSSAQNRFAAKVTTIEPSATIVRIGVLINPALQLIASVTPAAQRQMQLKIGDLIEAEIKATSIHCVRRDEG